MFMAGRLIFGREQILRKRSVVVILVVVVVVVVLFFCESRPPEMNQLAV